MRAQAKRCTQQELAYLSYWRRQGFNLAIDDPIPLSTVTPPSLATRRPIVDALVGGLLVIVVLALAAAWLGKAARLY